MLPSLFDDERTGCQRLSLMLCCGALLVAPFCSEGSTAASAAAAVAVRAARVPRLPPPRIEPSIRIARDPFVPEPSLVGAARSSDVTPESVFELPPNLGASDATDKNGVTSGPIPVLRAIVLGPASRALVETGSGVRVVAIGDTMAGSVVTAIDAAGIVLASGVRIRIARKQQ